MLKRVYTNWWARKMVGGLSKEQQELWRVQLLAHKFLAGKKDGFNMRTAYDLSYTPNKEQLQRFESGNSFSLFDDTVEKLNRKGKLQRRQLVLTKTTLYKLDPGFHVVPKRQMELTSIKDVSVSRFRDSFVVIHSHEEGKDTVLNLAADGTSHLGEFLARLYVASRDAGNKFPVHIVDSFKFNNTQQEGKPEKMITLRENPAGPVAQLRGNMLMY